jgi:outer membrane protein TolC
LPEVAVAEARVRQAEADLDVAQRDRHPDPTWKLGYSSMMEERDNRVTVGVAFALPVQRGRREAMVDEAAARIAARRHEHAAALAEAARELAVAAFDRDNDRRALELVETQQVPTARRLAETARAGLAAGTVPLATALRAERAVIATQLQAAELRAALARAEAPLAELPAADASDIPMGTPP